MDILFVIDTMDNLERKLSLLEPFAANIKFFVKSDIAASLIKKKNIVKNMVAIYNNHVNITIDKYLRKEDYQPTDTLLCYASAELSAEMINQIRDRLALKPNTIYIKKKLNWWGRLKLWFYNKAVKLMFGIEDAYASIKLQYFSSEMMEALKNSNFKNHIFEIPGAITVELDKEKELTHYAKVKFNKTQLFNAIAFCFILMCYTIMERFLDLPFWVYLFIVALLITVVINTFVMIIKDMLDKRYKK